MRLGRLIASAGLAVAFVALAAMPVLAQSSLGIGAAEQQVPSTGLFPSLMHWVNQQQQDFYRALTGALKSMRDDGQAAWYLVGLSFAYGVFHAAGPGHGKAVISSYMLANEVALKRGIMLSFISAFLQGITAPALLQPPLNVLRISLHPDGLAPRIDNLLPRDHAPVVRQIAHDIDRTLASFVRGQGTVCLILGAFYAIALMLIGLQFGLVIGVTAGLLTFIPYVGALVGGALSIGLALFQFWGEWWMIGAVAIVFFFGQFIEGNVLSPNLVGQSVGLHPVWLIFALSAFGSMFGFVGMLVGVPVAAAIGVVVRFFIDRYREGLLYRGLAGRIPGDPSGRPAVFEDTPDPTLEPDADGADLQDGKDRS